MPSDAAMHTSPWCTSHRIGAKPERRRINPHVGHPAGAPDPPWLKFFSRGGGDGKNKTQHRQRRSDFAAHGIVRALNAQKKPTADAHTGARRFNHEPDIFPSRRVPYPPNT